MTITELLVSKPWILSRDNGERYINIRASHLRAFRKELMKIIGEGPIREIEYKLGCNIGRGLWEQYGQKVRSMEGFWLLADELMRTSGWGKLSAHCQLSEHEFQAEIVDSAFTEDSGEHTCDILRGAIGKALTLFSGQFLIEAKETECRSSHCVFRFILRADVDACRFKSE